MNVCSNDFVSQNQNKNVINVSSNDTHKITQQFNNFKENQNILSKNKESEDSIITRNKNEKLNISIQNQIKKQLDLLFKM